VEGGKTLSNIFVFGRIGLHTGAATRLLYPGRHPLRILATLALGMAGGLVGGMLSWKSGPGVDDQDHSRNLLRSVLGAAIVIAFWAGLDYARSLSGRRRSTP
jgi:uncharacterized membrane protein YeaQ/YmgE (transglycosylase-associated protein family)